MHLISVFFLFFLHFQPEELTFIVEISNIVFSGIFAVEMLLKVIAEGPFGYISNGFNVFDGVIVILRFVQAYNSSFFLFLIWKRWFSSKRFAMFSHLTVESTQLINFDQN